MFFSQRRGVSQRTQRAAGSLRAGGQLLAPLSFEIFRFKISKKVTRYLQTNRLPLRLCVPLRALREKKGAKPLFESGGEAVMLPVINSSFAILINL